MTPLGKPLRIQSEQAYIVTSAALGSKVSQNFSDYATKLETVPATGRRDGDLGVLRVGADDEMFVRCCGVPATETHA